MNDVHKLNELLAALGARYSIPNLRLSPDGAIGLRLKDGSELYLEHDDERGAVYAYVKLMPLPDEDDARLKLFAAMLGMNFLESGLNGVLSVKESAAVCHVRMKVDGLNLEAFDQALQGLLAQRKSAIDELQARMEEDALRPVKTVRSTSTLLANFGRR
jgi:hypothetical protein